MKLAHLSDVHLGFRRYHRLTAQGINQREADVAQAFRRAVDDLVEVQPDVVIVAGDLFHSVRPTNPAILHAFNQFRRLRDALPHAPIVIVAGNHDTPRSVETGSILRLFEAVEGVRVVLQDPRTLTFPDLDLAVLGVPRAALSQAAPPRLRPEHAMGRNVLVLHGEVAGVLPARADQEYGAATVEPSDLHVEEWDYVALGHYHVAHRVAANAWYAGALEYVTTNPWGELQDEAAAGRPGKKGWLLVELADPVRVEFRPVALARRFVDLEPIAAAGLGSEEIDQLLTERVAAVGGGIADRVVRQRVFDVPRPVARDLNHALVRSWKAEALHYHLDLRRPPPSRHVGVGAPGERQTLADILGDYLRRRPIDAAIDREALVALGQDYMRQVEQALREE